MRLSQVVERVCYWAVPDWTGFSDRESLHSYSTVLSVGGCTSDTRAPRAVIFSGTCP